MIVRLRGIILEKQPPQLLLETHGVGYEVYMPISCFYMLPEIGQEAIILTHCLIRENIHLLFGFIHQQERILFRELIKIHGIGTKLALAILSEISVKKFITIIEQQDINSLVTLPGIGKKTAKRLMMEMKDKLKDSFNDLCMFHDLEEGISPAGLKNQLASRTYSPETEAVIALISLGYKPKEAKQLVSKVAGTETNCASLIRNALRSTL